MAPRSAAAPPSPSAGAPPSASSASSSLPSVPSKWPPPFTLATLREAVPAHCFERSALNSLRYVAQDLAMAGALGYAATWISVLPAAAGWLLWPAYWAACGTVLTGVWVLAHECGHGGFSDSTLLNDFVGWVLHSLLLVPYFSWKYTCVGACGGSRRALCGGLRRARAPGRAPQTLPLPLPLPHHPSSCRRPPTARPTLCISPSPTLSHAAHHKNTNSCEHDEVFVPALRSETPPVNDTPLAHLIGIIIMLTVGWCVCTLPPLRRRRRRRRCRHNAAPPSLSPSLLLTQARLPAHEHHRAAQVRRGARRQEPL